MRLTTSTPTNFDLIYPLEETVFRGSMQTWVGEYKKPAAQATFTVQQTRATVPLPAQNTEHEFLPRAWAKARVDALLEKIEREGEDQASIDEIIRLSRKYKFVTPYTSFLAAPRALLRPRLIRPGDPVLRVKTDESITSVVAMFPFGTVKKLRYLAGEDTWQTRFLAPKDLADGTYRVRLLLRDKQGRTYQRIENVRDREPASGGQSEARPQAVSSRRHREAARQRVGYHANDRGANARRGSRVSAMECGDGIEHRRTAGAGDVRRGPLQSDRDGRGFRAQHRQRGGGN